MKISQELARALADGHFLKTAVEVVEAHFPQEVSASPRVAARIAAHCIDIARTYGLETECDIICFMLHMLTISPNFHQEPLINAVLSSKSIPNDEKLERILHAAFDEPWQRAAQAPAECYWSRVVEQSSSATHDKMRAKAL